MHTASRPTLAAFCSRSPDSPTEMLSTSLATRMSRMGLEALSPCVVRGLGGGGGSGGPPPARSRPVVRSCMLVQYCRAGCWPRTRRLLTVMASNLVLS